MMVFTRNGNLMMDADGTEMPVSLDAIVQASIILLIGISIIVANVIVIATLLTMPGPKDVLCHYMLSLAVADLLCGILVVPLSIYPAIVHQWVYGDIVCRVSGYIEVTLWSVSVYTFMWMGVDRYLAIRKPLRYETVQTKTRCQCWMVFTWITSTFLCCPPLLSFTPPYFDRQAYVCMLDWGSMVAYSITLSILVLGPSVITIFYTYSYIFNTMRKLKQCMQNEDKEFATALSENMANPNHAMSFVLIFTFWLSWSPWIGLKVYQTYTQKSVEVPYLYFSLFWIGVMNSFWKSIIYSIMSPRFRCALRLFCMSLCCRWKGQHTEYI